MARLVPPSRTHASRACQEAMEPIRTEPSATPVEQELSAWLQPQLTTLSATEAHWQALQGPMLPTLTSVLLVRATLIYALVDGKNSFNLWVVPGESSFVGWQMVRAALICGLVDGDSSFNLWVGGW